MPSSQPAYHTKCLMCNHTELRTLDDYKKSGLVKCKNCGLVFSKFIPTAQELEDYYDSYPSDPPLSDVTVKRYHELLDTFEPYRKSGKLLDVGCGVGFFLKVAAERGWEVQGTEYSDVFVDICRKKGIDMKKGALDPENYDLQSFDVITSFEVVEHINNHQTEIPNIVSLLRKGGLFYCTTPNFNALSRYYLKEKYNIINYPEHLTYFTPKTLGDFERFGLEKLKVTATGISISRFETSTANEADEIAKQEGRNKEENLRQEIEKKKYLQIAKSVANGILNATGTGYALKSYFRKK